MRSIIIFSAFIVSVMWLSGTVSAATLGHYGIDIQVERNLHARTVLSLEPNSPISHLEYNLGFTIYNLTSESESGTVNCDYENDVRSSIISCDFFGMAANKTNIKLGFTTKDAVKPQDDKYVFRETFPMIMDTEELFVLLKLPEKSAFSEEVINQSFSPPDGRIFTDGRHMFIVWERTGLESGDSISFSVSFESVSQGGMLWSFTVIAITAVVVGIMVAIGLYMSRGSRKRLPAEVKVLPLLNNEEKKVVDILVKHEGTARQREIVRESDFSKAKVSRLIKNLKERGVIDTEAISGRENKVILKIKGIG
ncbi:MAG: hypothetical protein JW789_03190 [Candidatus Aenigmarchaeota archaeon]|nr:hypothetical protein [Candidatus Aenigmarchaeota archaeon]